MKPIHVYFDTLVHGWAKGNGLMPEFRDKWNDNLNANVKIRSDIYGDLEYIDLDYKVYPIEQISERERDCHRVYFFEPSNLKLFKGTNIFEYISDIAKEYIRNNKIHLIIYYPFEAFPVNRDLFRNELLRPIVESINIEKFSFDNVSLVYGDLNIIENYKKINKTVEEKKFTRIFPLDYWEMHHQRHAQFTVNKIPENNTSIRPHKFLCFNGALRNHRLMVVSELHRRNIIDHGLVSAIGRYGADGWLENTKWPYTYFDVNDSKELEMAQHLEGYLQNWKPRFLDINTDEINQDDRQFDERLYLDTYFSVVTETSVADNVLFITEKTFKPIVSMHPFVMIGPRGILAHLRKHGYKTFPEIFDESYDNEPDDKKRILKVLDMLETICHSCPSSRLRMLYNRVWPTLVHNRNNFFARNHTDKYRNMFKQILEKNQHD